MAEFDPGETRHPRTYAQSLAILSAVVRQVTRIFGPRTYEAHLPFDDVQELRQFIHFCLPQESTNPGDPRVIVVRHRGSHSLGPIQHSSEFEYPKHTGIFSQPVAPVEHRAWGIELYE